MNKHNLNLIFEQYASRFAELNDVDGNDEGYKWRAESCFVEHWDIDAEDFVSMFKAATKEMSNLIDNATVQPIGGILLLLKHQNEVEFVRECFRKLYQEDGGNLEARQDRIYAFMEKMNAKIDQYVSGSWKYPQKMNNVIYYLSLRYPSDNYFFKATEATEWANCIEYGDDFGSGETFSLAKYYKMCDELRDAVSENEEIMELHSRRLEKEARGFDDDLHILVYDIIYCAHTYLFYTDGIIQTTSAKERIKRAKIHEEIEQFETELAAATERSQSYKDLVAHLIDMTGMEVEHKAFGKGVVVSQANSIQIISFPSGEKKFQFPTAYTGGFLKADETIMTVLNSDAANRAEADKADKEMKSLSDKIATLKKSL